MPALAELLRNADLAPPDVEWLHLLIGDWQLLSDLSFADLVLWVPLTSGPEAGSFVAVAQCRPSTGATSFHDDLVGRVPPRRANPLVDAAWQTRRTCRDREPHWVDDVPVRQEATPVVGRGRLLAVLSRHTNLGAARTPSRLELTYLHCADDLVRMISVGDFPSPGAPTGPRRGAPRVGDGLIRLDVEGRVSFASPNANSALHRFGFVGDLVGRPLAQVVTPLLDSSGQVDESLPLVLSGRAPWRSDIEARGSALSMRAIPLTVTGERTASMVLVRDVSELRRRERELLTKDATIREVHHRVKNNLQVVAALLRLQARRITSADGKAALTEAMRRVSTIAMVHETLSSGLTETVDFDQVVDRTVALAVELAGTGSQIVVHREGTFGELEAANASPLALVLTELVTNAVEHGLAGSTGGLVTITALREGTALRAVVRDDGRGLPVDFRPGRDGLGTQIVQALVAGEMQGRITWNSPLTGGTEVVVDVTVRSRGSTRPGTRP